MKCIIIVLGLLCFDDLNDPDRDFNKQPCKIEKELGYLVCLEYPRCNLHYTPGLSYVSDTYIKKK